MQQAAAHDVDIVDPCTPLHQQRDLGLAYPLSQHYDATKTPEAVLLAV